MQGMVAMKRLILLGFFLVTWNEWELVPHYKKVSRYYDVTFGTTTFTSEYKTSVEDGYTVEMATHSVKLATEKDVERFRGHILLGHTKEGAIDIKDFRGAIGEKAFNIRVEKKP